MPSSAPIEPAISETAASAPFFSGSLAHRTKLDATDLRNIAILALLTFLLNITGLGALEYFRHTEADRTLIAWEMYESGDYLVPKLLHSVILTKPPLYYWTLAAAMHLFGGVSEWIARFPSVFFSVLFAILQYVVARKAGGSRDFAILSSLMLITSFTMFQQSTVAEIDLLYGLISAVAFSLAYFASIRASVPLLLAAYASAAVAFLAKGPPVIFFFLAGQFFFSLALLRKRRLTNEFFSFRETLLWNVLGAVLFTAIVSTWLAFVASRVGWDELGRQFRVEVLDRIASETHNPRGGGYYFGALFLGLMPWTPVFVSGLFLVLYRRSKNLPIPELDSIPGGLFTLFNAIYLGAAFAMLSIAEGKSIRYLFPVHFCAVYLTAIYLPIVARSKIMPWLIRLCFAIAVVLTIGIPIAAFTLRLPGVEMISVLRAASTLTLLFGLLAYACFKSKGTAIIFMIFICMLGARRGQMLVYAPNRNHERGVKPIVEAIDHDLPPGAVLYNVELFERWINYYLKHHGRESYRLSPEEAKNPRAVNGRVYLLLHHEEESWRIEQLREVDPTVKVIEEFNRRKAHFLLVEADAAALKHLQPHEGFPTKPSHPWYTDPARAAATASPPEHEGE